MYIKVVLSGSVDGKQILIASSTGSSPTPIHTAATGSNIDEVWLYAYNDATASIQCSIYWGGTNESTDVVRVNLPARAGRTLLTDGKLLKNGLTISAYAEITNFVSIDGFVNRITSLI